jgi:hypothetical protein
MTHPHLIANPGKLQQMMRQQENWDVDGDHLDEILIDLDLANADDVFAMPNV